MLTGIPYSDMDCWALTRHAQKTLFDRELPEIQVPESERQRINMIENHAERKRWQRTETPEPGDIVLLGRGGHATHIGTVIRQANRNRILHTTEATGSVTATERTLACFDVMGYWRFVG